MNRFLNKTGSSSVAGRVSSKCEYSVIAVALGSDVSDESVVSDEIRKAICRSLSTKAFVRQFRTKLSFFSADSLYRSPTTAAAGVFAVVQDGAKFVLIGWETATPKLRELEFQSCLNLLVH